MRLGQAADTQEHEDLAYHSRRKHQNISLPIGDTVVCLSDASVDNLL